MHILYLYETYLVHSHLPSSRRGFMHAGPRNPDQVKYTYALTGFRYRFPCPEVMTHRAQRPNELASRCCRAVTLNHQAIQRETLPETSTLLHRRPSPLESVAGGGPTWKRGQERIGSCVCMSPAQRQMRCKLLRASSAAGDQIWRRQPATQGAPAIAISIHRWGWAWI